MVIQYGTSADHMYCTQIIAMMTKCHGSAFPRIAPQVIFYACLGGYASYYNPLTEWMDKQSVTVK
jgi:hypothetical protein